MDRRTVLRLAGAGVAGTGGLAGAGTTSADHQGGDPPTTGASASAITYDWFLNGCRAAIAVVPVDAAALEPHLPDGFRPLTPAEFGLPPDPRGDAVIGVEALFCDSGAALDGTITDVPYVSYFAPVQPPEARRDPDVRYHFVKWDVLIEDEALRAELSEHGVPAEPGDVNYRQAVEAAQQFVFDVTGTLCRETSRLTGSANQPDAEPEAFAFIEFTEADAGLVTWDVQVTDANMRAGTGRLEVPPGSLPADVIGREQTQAYMLGGSLSFSDATITVPRRADRTRR